MGSLESLCIDTTHFCVYMEVITYRCVSLDNGGFFYRSGRVVEVTFERNDPIKSQSKFWLSSKTWKSQKSKRKLKMALLRLYILNTTS